MSAASFSFNAGDEPKPDQLKSFREMFGPMQIDTQVRQAIQFCWMGLNADQKTADELERQIRRIVDRALRDFREDLKEFGSTPSK